MSEFSNNWEGVANDSDDVAETHHYKFVIPRGGNAAGYTARTFVESLSDGNPLNINVDGIRTQDIRDKSQSQHDELLAIISAESVVPYERPALSKAYIHPPGAKVRLRLPNFNTCVGTKQPNQSEAWYNEHKIKLFLSHEAIEIDCINQVCEKFYGAV